jgi:hypothetical protein
MFTNKNGFLMLKSLTVKQVHNIITEAQGLNAKHPPHPLGISGMTAMTANVVAYANDQRKLKQEIAGLSYDARMELMALMWIGRDFDGDYDAALAHARKSSDEGDVDYIADKSPALPTYLRDGLKKIGVGMRA